MKNAEYRHLLKDDIIEPIYKITEAKAHDYAREDDTLSNFKIQASMRAARGGEHRASDVAFDFVLTKMARLGNLRNKEPQNESVLDTIRDAINYLGLYYACRVEETRSEEA